MNVVFKARLIAEEAHADQRYGDHTYDYHLYQVAQMVKDCIHMIPEEFREKAIAAAWLHDIIEDTTVTKEDLLEHGFDEQLVNSVVRLTKQKDIPYEVYIDSIRYDVVARFVKLCDSSCNLMNSINDRRIKNINKYTKQIQLLGGFN